MKKLILSLLLAGTFTGPNIALTQETFYRQLVDSAFTLTRDRVVYDPSYFCMGYPNGDVPADRGVCTDVVIRAFRKLGIDLQKEEEQ